MAMEIEDKEISEKIDQPADRKGEFDLSFFDLSFTPKTEL